MISGRGAVQTLSSVGFVEHDLRPGGLLTFTPGTVHRLVNGGGLEIIVLMANSGLPEAGDAVLTFPADVVADPEGYAKAATLDGTLESAHRRRDLAVEGFHELQAQGPDGLAAFYTAAVTLKQPELDIWHARWQTGALHAAQVTGAQLAALRRGDPSHLANAAVTALDGPIERGRFGMCGKLDTYRP